MKCPVCFGSGMGAPVSGAPMNIMIGNLYYGTEGWAALSDQGFQVFKGESNELVTEDRVTGSSDRTTSLQMQNFLVVGRKLTVTPGPKFTNDAEANKLLTREYRKAYVV